MADTGATGQIPEVVHIDAVEEAVAPVNAAVKGEPVDAQAQNPLKRGAEATEDDGPDAKRLHVAQLEQNG